MAEEDVMACSDKTEKEKFGKHNYWEERYKTEESFDWFCRLSSFEHLLVQHIHPTDHMLNLGCGNSTLSATLHEKGYHTIDNIDFSGTVIERMREKSRCMPSLKWHVMDMLDLKFKGETFDVVLDKGSIDSLMVDQGDVWNPKPEVLERVEKALSEVGLLKILSLISY